MPASTRATSIGSNSCESGGRKFSGNPLAPDGGPLDPEFGHQHELGIKLADPDGAYMLTASIFRIRRENFTIGSGIPGFSIQSGAAQSQGIEFDFGGAVTDNLIVTANYAYFDARTINDSNVAEIGRQLRQVPYNKANLWTRYNFYDDEDGAFGVGFGVQWTDESRTFLAQAPILPSFVKFDAGLFYRDGRFFVNTNFDNITDIRYFTTGSSTGFDVGAPFTVRATAGITY